MDKKFKESVKRAGLCSFEKIVVAVSGGVDSVVLLNLFSGLHPHENMIIAHVNHGIRKESSNEAQFVETLAKKYGIELVSKELNLKKNSSEEEARDKRYAFLRKVASNFGATYLVLGHHADDQAETVLLKIFRGAGPASIWGMKEHNGILWRPLLEVAKDEIVKYAKENKLKYVVDPSNQDIRYSRNRVRLNILPEANKINPKVRESLIREIALGHELSDYVNQETRRWHKKIVKNGVVSASTLLKAPSFMRKNVLKSWLSENMGRQNIYSKNITEVINLAKTSGSKKTEIGQFTIEKIYDKIKFGQTEADNLPNTVISGPRTKYGAFLFKQKTPVGGKARKDNIYLPLSLKDSLVIRSPKEGDKIKTVVGTKKLQDIFTDAKIPRSKRASWPVVVFKKEIVWVPLLVASKRALSKPSIKCLKIEVEIEKKRR